MNQTNNPAIAGQAAANAGVANANALPHFMQGNNHHVQPILLLATAATDGNYERNPNAAMW